MIIHYLQVRLEKKKYQIKTIELRANIIPRKIYANFLPIKAVSGSSFTLIFYPIFLINVAPYPIKLSSFDYYLPYLKSLTYKI